ncbi:MAG: hypothetical protein IJR58_07115 [Lachnospiraceae bacterium]|nr:hypothetical protein [Lachnospiraceae bacterium]
MDKQYDYNKLREHLIAYFEKGLMAGFQAAKVDLEQVKSATDEELVEIAEYQDFEMSEYLK